MEEPETGESLAEAVAGIVADLPAGHVAAWTDVLRDAARPDATTEAALINTRPGYGISSHARRLIDAWRRETTAPFPPAPLGVTQPTTVPSDLTAGSGAALSGPAVALALASAEHVHRRASAQRTELVVSGPTTSSVPVRLTSSVVIQVIRAAQRSLLIVSFAAYGVVDVVTELLAAAGRGVHIDLILEGTADEGGALRGQTGAAAVFEKLREQAVFWHWPADRRPVAGSSRAALHAKIIAADTGLALISSANLTDRALSSNIEVGVVLREREVVERLVQHFTALMRTDTGPLRHL